MKVSWDEYSQYVEQNGLNHQPATNWSCSRSNCQNCHMGPRNSKWLTKPAVLCQLVSLASLLPGILHRARGFRSDTKIILRDEHWHTMLIFEQVYREVIHAISLWIHSSFSVFLFLGVAIPHIDPPKKRGYGTQQLHPGPALSQAAALNLGPRLAANGGAVHDADPIHVAQAPARDAVAEGHRDGRTVHLPCSDCSDWGHVGKRWADGEVAQFRISMISFPFSNFRSFKTIL